MIVVLAVGHGLPEFLLLMGVTTAAVLNLGRIRSRSKLIYVGLFAGGVAVAALPGHGHDRRPAARPGAAERRAAATGCGPWRPASS